MLLALGGGVPLQKAWHKESRRCKHPTPLQALAEAERPLDCNRFSDGRLHFLGLVSHGVGMFVMYSTPKPKRSLSRERASGEEAEAAEAAAVVVDVDAPALLGIINSKGVLRC